MVQRKDIKTEDIVELYESGLIGKEIAEQLGCSISLVQTRLGATGVKMRASNARKTLEVDKHILKEMYWDKKMHPVEIGRILGIHKNTVTKKMREFGISLRTKSEARIKELNPIYGVGHTVKTREKMSEVVFNGQKNMTVSSNNRYGCSVEYKGNVFRSRWEYGFAKHLDDHGIDWEYEPVRLTYFHTGIKKTYIPDFYLPKGFLKSAPCYVEIKGFCDDLGKSKLSSIKSQIDNLIVLYREDLIQLGIIDTSGKVII